MTFRPLTCEQCFLVNDCEVKEEQILLEDRSFLFVVEWNCPDVECRHFSQISYEGDIEEALDAYERRVRSLAAAFDDTAPLSPAEKKRRERYEEERSKFVERLMLAQARDQSEGGSRNETRARFGYWFRLVRRGGLSRQPMSIEKAARSIGISREHLSGIELGKEGYSTKTVLGMAKVIGATESYAFQKASLPPPAKTATVTSAQRAEKAHQDYVAALEHEDTMQFLAAAFLAHRRYHTAKRGGRLSVLLSAPPDIVAITAAQEVISALRALNQRERIAMFRTIALTELSKERRYLWISELVMNVLNDEQKAEMLKSLSIVSRKVAKKT